MILRFNIFRRPFNFLSFQKTMANKDEKETREKIIELVHNIFVEVEGFLKHKTFTSIKDGFSILISGIQIFKASI